MRRIQNAYAALAGYLRSVLSGRLKVAGIAAKAGRRREESLTATARKFTAMRNHAIDLDTAGRSGEAIELLDSAASQLRNILNDVVPGDDPANLLHELLFQMYVDMGVCAVADGDYAAADGACRGAFLYFNEIRQKYPLCEPVTNVNRAWAMVQHANAQDHLGSPEDALLNYQAAISLLEPQLSLDAGAREWYEAARLNMAVTLLNLGRAGEALPHLEWVTSERARRLVSDTREPFARPKAQAPDWQPRHRLAFAQYALAQALADVGRRDDALVAVNAACDAWKQLIEVEGHVHLVRFLPAALRQ